MSGIIELEGARGPESRVGQELNGKWTLVRVLGAGGASVVYEAVHRNGRRAAVKLMSTEALGTTPSQPIASREAWLANAVAHPGVVNILDDDVTADGAAYLVMELLDGETLEQRRSRMGGRLPLADALPLFDQLFEVLAAAHDRGVVHRDIKPDNVFVTRDGLVKVLDFGLAARRDDTDQREDDFWFGTPGFMPPEQARADWPEVDARSDQWAVAATLHCVLTGRLVHEGSTPSELLLAAATEDVDPSSLEEVVPLRVADVIARALSPDKADRWPSVRAMMRALRAAATAPRRAARVATRPSSRVCRATWKTRFFVVEESGGYPDAQTIRVAV